MKPRSNPTDEQLTRRKQKEPVGPHNPRVRNDAYWALRHQGYPDAVARRAIRSIAPRYYIAENKAVPDDDEYLRDVDPEDLLIVPQVNVEFTKMAVEVRPDLTEDIVASAPAEEKEYTIWSPNLPCFGLRIRPSGCRSFIVKYRIAGSERQGKITLGKAGTLPLDLARNIAREVLIEARAGFDPQSMHKSGELMRRARSSSPS
ncbi:Arm DNA-binding domain-containing protein [Dinoroseobacter sp. S76]|uniref:Arm DNA-binding domain-containing protein n=1 Tax=Dinoroseobacter sp. S76 TaxID=3415124 RepID=UPI003C7A4F84